MTTQGTLERADVLVRGGRVVEVGSGLAAAAGANVIEANGRPLTPGLFGGITGLGISEIELESSTVDRSALVGSGAPARASCPGPNSTSPRHSMPMRPQSASIAPRASRSR